jgi:GDP/UDP-N,N'-diacetylbacillosamine 2-epimerase (hydrolysing)
VKTIGIFTTTRGDMATLTPLIEEIRKCKKLRYFFFVGGTHLIKNYGSTINEIKKNKNIVITKLFKYKINLDKKNDIAESLADANFAVSKIFKNYKMDIVCLLGDRFEKLAIVNNAIVNRVPMFHLCGGERTEGAIDEIIRHIFTKASHLHFAACEQYKKNILNMGEEKKRVYNVGHLAIDNIKKNKQIKKNKKKYVICTVHPETQNKKFNSKILMKNIIKVLKKENLNVIFTKPGHDEGSSKIEKIIKKECLKNKKFEFIKSLGYKKLFEIYNQTAFVIGNSSGGLLEVPYFRIPTINIGNRQRGRFLHDSVVQCSGSPKSINYSLKKIKSKKFMKKLKKMKLYFGSGNTAKKIVKVLLKTKVDNNFMQKRLVV